MDTNAPKKKPTLGQRIKNMFSSKNKTKTTTEHVEEVHEVRKVKTEKDKHVDKHVQQVVPPGPVLVPAVMIPVVGAPQQNAAFIQPQAHPAPPPIPADMMTERQAFGSIIESRPIGAQDIPAQPIMAGPAPVPVQQVPQPVLQQPPIQLAVEPIPAPIVTPVTAPAPAPAPPIMNPGSLYQPVGEIFPPPITQSVMGPAPPAQVYTETKMVETRYLGPQGGIPIESGGMVYNQPVLQPNQGVYVEQGQQMLAPHLRNIVEITGTQPPDPTVPRDLIVGPADIHNPVFRENLQNLKHDPEYISRHLAESNPAKPKPFEQLNTYGKIPNPSYAGGKPFFVDMLYNPDPLVPLSQYPEAHQHIPLQLIGQKNAELHQINKMNEVQIKEHQEIMKNDPRYR